MTAVRSGRLRLALIAAGALAAVLVLGADRLGGHGGGPAVHAIPDIARAAGAALVIFAACGYAPAVLLCPPELERHRPLLVLPLGAAVSGLVLTLLGAFRVPLPASLAIVLLAGAAGAIAVRRRGYVSEPGPRRDLLWAALIALTVALLAASPLIRHDSFATVLGENGDAHLATGAAELLQHAPPGATRVNLPIDHMPGVWSSKYPIYYVLAGTSTLSGLDPVQTFGTVIAIMAALTVLGFFLLAAHVLGAGSRAALIAMGLVALDRLVFRLAFDPFYNQLWALFAFPYVLVSGWLYLHRPGRGTLTLLAAFGLVSVFAYPLLAPFPALFLALTAWRIWRGGERPRWIGALRLPRGRRSLLLWIPAGIVLVPICLVLLLAALDKMVAAAKATLPGGDLAPWSGKTPGFQPVAYFVGLPKGLWIGAVAIVALALAELWRQPRDVSLPLGITLGAFLAAAGWFDLRNGGALFHFRALSFFGPTAVLLAGLTLARWTAVRDAGWRWAAAAATAAIAVLQVTQVRASLANTFPHVTPRVWQLREWSSELPQGASVRVDVVPVGVQQWSWYMFAAHPVSSTHPLRAFYPYAPVSRKADYVLITRKQRRPIDAAGRPVLSNSEFLLYRMKRSVPGPDRSSRKQVTPSGSTAGE